MGCLLPLRCIAKSKGRSFFEIGLNQRDISLIYQLKDFFEGIGTISLDKKTNVLKYSTACLKDLSSIVIPHFKKYPLLTPLASLAFELRAKDVRLRA